MFSYLALIWNPANPAHVEAARTLKQRLIATSREWQLAANTSGLLVVCRGSRSGSVRPHPLHQNAGVVLGTLFHRSSMTPGDAPRKAVLGPAETKSIVTSAGRELVTAYWGQYVAFITGAAAGKRWVLKDPAGGLPCYCTTFEGVQIFFSRLQDCLTLGLPRFTIDWGFMTTRVAAGPTRQPRTALREVRRVDSGECVEISGEQISRRYYWDPREIARSNPVEDASEAAALLRDTVKACVHAWASCYESLVLRLSGGLDSSIVLGCLKSAPSRPRIVSVVYYVPQTTGADERAFARLAAADAKCELVEQDRTLLTLRFEDLLQVPFMSWP
jgi:asparagine synthase (glutamine-hydrolysing)